ncbi:glucans biosynthesis glucosyltransferase MdoH [Nitrosococcus watsonii]|uniref:Glucans biosynthesis glucosyltransferase H n=1 Tax=Nitrosococcus watsoni (strain C-113) TaxID=105559 RepID=D8KA28_NITWC|nr:glucans biosynthesis glucosyltransferase MdoH [Nitrosococcus watsonii]ADJ29386.1 glycosyl transferase family 2 [Nitrosococcus watsonii C-113]
MTFPAISKYKRILRRQIYYGLVLITTFGALFLLTGVFQKGGITLLEGLLLLLYMLLILWISASFWTAILGFWSLLRQGDDPLSISAWTLKKKPTTTPSPLAKTALVMPIYNEEPQRVFAGLRAIYQSLLKTGQAETFDIFILSDTQDPDLWVEEEWHWHRMCQELNAHGRIFYRNREQNSGRKSGNIADFCKRWGDAYRYMIVLDADSLMGGRTLVQMVELMEAHPSTALIQAPPRPVNRESLFARILQFGASLYGPLFNAGIAFWQLGQSNYWGHNAIIRIQPFVQHCDLPKLSGREPFGGEILSHDFVEAALLHKAGWEVWLAPDLRESYEELPSTLIDYAKRDRRWCQGNLQHLCLLFSPGWRSISRLHLLMGIMSYLASPLWLLFLIVAAIEAYIQSHKEIDYFLSNSLFPVWPESYAIEMTTVLIVTLSMLFVPKLLSLVLLFLNKQEQVFHGGMGKASLSVVLETLFSALIAPILMLYQSRFVTAILLRQNIGWPSQRRDEHKLGLKEAWVAHRGQTLLGLTAGLISYFYIPVFFWWLTPVLIGLVLSIPLSMYSSSIYLGQRAREKGLFLIPEETWPPQVLILLHENLASLSTQSSLDGQGAKRLFGDSEVRAIHLHLLPERTLSKRERYYLKALNYKLIEQGFDSLSAREKRYLLSDPKSLKGLSIELSNTG